MLEAEEQSRDYWRQLRDLWLQIDDHWENNWHGPNADHFRRDFWESFEFSINKHLDALAELRQEIILARNILLA